MTKKEKYIKDQMECGIKVGDKVRILRKSRSHVRGWGTCWIGVMDESVGKVLKIEGEGDEVGFRLPDGCYYPFFVLEKITPKKGGKVKGKVVTKSRK